MVIVPTLYVADAPGVRIELPVASCWGGAFEFLSPAILPLGWRVDDNTSLNV